MELIITCILGSVTAIAMATSNYFTNRYKIKTLQRQFTSLKDYLAQFEGGIITVKCPNCGRVIPVDANALILKMDEIINEHNMCKINPLRGDSNDSN